MGLVCNPRNLLLFAALLGLGAIYWYSQSATLLILFLLVVPVVMAIAFLLLWVLTTATGLAGYGKLFLIVYLLSLGLIEAAAWWTYAQGQWVSQTPGYTQQEYIV